ncbi:hypothetical protein BDV98DRAFT_565661 [Pterulicium gracile]|uniref:Uncharacterized protein n=1 Tax=Pterulicium gracile TaxID=1884261 RepID=A0A5C3QPV8_9AGAR|nr:hypothetical protein BDV98DRAFT_565661 [Pterula gracilis]
MSKDPQKFTDKLEEPVAVSEQEVDTAAQLLAAGADILLEPVESRRVLRKIDLHLLPLMCTLYWQDNHPRSHRVILNMDVSRV